MNESPDEPGSNRHTTYGDEPSVHFGERFVRALDELVPDEPRRYFFIRDGIVHTLLQYVIRHATRPRDGHFGRCSWIGRDALLITEQGYDGVASMLVSAHYELTPTGIEVWLDDARAGTDAYDEEDTT